MQQIAQPFMLLNDLRGEPLQNGRLYFGVTGQNPINVPIVVYWDSDGTIPAAQPILTINGAPANDGTPATLYVMQSQYSFSAYDKNNILVFYNNAIFFDGPLVTETTNGWMSAVDKVILDGLPPQVADAESKAGAALDRANASLPLNGGTMFGGITLPDYPYPTVPLQAAQKKYVDQKGISAWAMIAGTGTIVYAGRNIASVSKLAAGLYQIAFQNNLEDANYAVSFTNEQPIALGNYLVSRAANNMIVQFFDTSGTAADSSLFSFMVSSGRVG